MIIFILDNDFLGSLDTAFSHLKSIVRTEHDIQLANTVSTCAISQKMHGINARDPQIRVL